MTALRTAITHARTCEAVESCAPTVSAPYLTAAIERCRLPIRVHCNDIGLMVAHELLPPPDSLYAICYDGEDPAQASRAYLDLVSQFEPAAASQADSTADTVAPPPDNATVAPAPAIPGVGALSPAVPS